MKNIIYTIFLVVLCVVITMSCETDEIDDFNEKTKVVLTSGNISSKHNFCDMTIGKYLNFSRPNEVQELKFGEDSALGNIVILSEPCFSFNLENTQ